MKMEKRNNRRSSLQYTGWMSEGISLLPPVAGGLFFLDIPLYRTRLPSMGTGTTLLWNHVPIQLSWRIPRFGSCRQNAGTVRGASLPSSANPAKELILLRIDN